MTDDILLGGQTCKYWNTPGFWPNHRKEKNVKLSHYLCEYDFNNAAR